MPRPEPTGAQEEARLAEERLEGTYRSYLASPRKQRSWAADNRGNVAIRAELLAHLLALAAPALRGGGDVLDIGCGSGRLLAELVDRGVDPQRLHGVDLLAPRIEAARGRLPGVDLRHADARALPFADDSFALVLLMLSLSSMRGREDIRLALAEARRVIARDGLLLVYEARLPNPLNPATVAVSARMLREVLGREESARALTGLPFVARHLGATTSYLYPLLSRLLPSHRLLGFRGQAQSKAI